MEGERRAKEVAPAWCGLEPLQILEILLQELIPHMESLAG